MKKYPITFWCAPTLEFTNDERYKEIADAGFTLVCPPLDCDKYNKQGIGKEENLKILDLCHEYGMQAIIWDKRINAAYNMHKGWEALLDTVVEDYRDHPALHSYYITDEPNAGEFPHLSEITGYLKKADPAHSSYINLFPNYATPEQLQSVDYRQHVESYIKCVKPSIVSYDHYHFMKEDMEVVKDGFLDEREQLIYEAAVRNADRPGFFENIEIIRAYSIKYDIPFMVIVLLVTHGHYRDLTEAEIRWEVFNSLAYGASCISYFTYWCPKDEPVWHFHNAVISYDGIRTEHYNEVKRINSDLSVLGSKLLGRKSEAVYHVGKESDNVTYFTSHKHLKQLIGDNLTLGIFEDGYMMLVNKDYRNYSDIYLKLADGLKLFRVDKVNGNEVMMQISNMGYSLRLAPGDGELLRIL